jgi:hypothetical protein
VIKLLSSLLSLLDRLWAAWNENKLRQQGRQEAQKEAADEVQRQIDLAEHAAFTPDPERDKRLRARFDDAANGDQ